MVSSVRSVMKATNLDNIYGSPLLDWSGVEARLNEGITQAPGTGGPNRHTCWLATINRDGSPHVTGIGGLWVDGAFWFETGETTRKGRNLARDQRCTLSVATAEFDLVVEGRARKVTDPTTVAELAGRWAAEGWPARVDDTGEALTADYSAPSAARHRGTSTASNLTPRQRWGQRSRSGPHGGTSDMARCTSWSPVEDLGRSIHRETSDRAAVGAISPRLTSTVVARLQQRDLLRPLN